MVGVGERALWTSSRLFAADRRQDQPQPRHAVSSARPAGSGRAADDRGRIDWLYRRLYARPATPEEIELGMSLLGEAPRDKPEDATAAWAQYCQILLCANEFMYVD